MARPTKFDSGDMPMVSLRLERGTLDQLRRHGQRDSEGLSGVIREAVYEWLSRREEHQQPRCRAD